MSSLVFPKNLCLICYSSLGRDYWCNNDYCYRQFGYCYRGEYADFNLIRSVWGQDSKTKYFVEYHQKSDYFHKAIIRSANIKNFGESLLIFDQPFDFKKYSAREIMEKIDKLVTFK